MSLDLVLTHVRRSAAVIICQSLNLPSSRSSFPLFDSPFFQQIMFPICLCVIVWQPMTFSMFSFCMVWVRYFRILCLRRLLSMVLNLGSNWQIPYRLCANRFTALFQAPSKNKKEVFSPQLHLVEFCILASNNYRQSSLLRDTRVPRGDYINETLFPEGAMLHWGLRFRATRSWPKNLKINNFVV